MVSPTERASKSGAFFAKRFESLGARHGVVADIRGEGLSRMLGIVGRLGTAVQRAEAGFPKNVDFTGSSSLAEGGAP